MRIMNKDKKTLLAEDAEIARSGWKKALGLMFRPRIPDSSGLLMEFGSEGVYPIWMFGMRFAIDIIFIDSKNKVVDIFRGARPLGLSPATWKVYSPRAPAMWVLEVASGKAGRTKTAVGDTISFG